MSLLRQCLYLQSRLAGHRGNAPVRSVSAAAAVRSVSSRSRLFHQSSPLPSWRKTRSCWTSCGEHDQRNNKMISFLVAQQPPQSKRPLLGRVLAERCFSSTHDPGENRKWFLDMKSCQTVEEAADEAFDMFDDLAPGSLSMFWTKVSQLIAPRYQSNKPTKQSYEHDKQQHLIQLNLIFSKTMGEMKTFDPKHLSQTAFGFAKIVRIVDNRGQRHLQGTPQQILHDILVGQQSQQKKIIFQSLANASMPILSKFDPRYLANLAYANAIVDSVPKFEDGSTLFDHIAEKSIPLLGKFEPQDLSNMVWSFYRVRAYNPRLFDEVANAIVALDHLGKFSPQALSNILSAFAKTKESNPRLFKKVADHIVEHGNLGEFYPQALATIIWSFTKAEVSHPKLFKKLADHILELDNLHSFNAQGCSNILWAFAKAEESDSRLFKKVADHIITLDNLHSFNPEALTNTVWAFAKTNESHPQLFKKVAGHIIALDNLHSFHPQNISNIVWAFAKTNESHPQLFKKVADHILALGNLPFNSRSCTQILWGFATANIIHRQLFETVAAHVNEKMKLETLDKESLKMLLWAFEKAEKAKAEESLKKKVNLEKTPFEDQ